MTGKNDLRACPFCGGVDRALSHGFYHDRDLDRIYFVECQCGASVEADSEDDAIGIWNTRSSGWEDIAKLVETARAVINGSSEEYIAAVDREPGDDDTCWTVPGKALADLEAALAKSLPSIGEPQ